VGIHHRRIQYPEPGVSSSDMPASAPEKENRRLQEEYRQ